MVSTLKLPSASENPWFSVRGSPNPKVRTESVSVSRRAMTKSSAQRVKLQRKKIPLTSVFYLLPRSYMLSERTSITVCIDITNTEISENISSQIPLLLVLVAEVEEARSVKQKLHQVVRDEQHQAQSVEAEQTGETERTATQNSGREERETEQQET